MRWRMLDPVMVSEELRAFVGGHALVAERLVRLGKGSVAAARGFLDPAAYAPASPFELPDLAGGVARLQAAIDARESILIWGDFDVDGQTATALLFTALRRLGAEVRYHVPLRDGEGHGMQLAKLREWLARGVRVIVTCDTGITSHESIAVAQAAGVDVIVTDHHLLGDSLPAARAVINPMRLAPGHPLREMPGVAVAWQLISALSEGRDCDDLLDLVALGIVADVAEQKNDTRWLLQRGLTRMRLSRRPGLQALLDLARVDPLELDETDVGFALGPRLNAQGRLGDAADSVELLSTDDPARAAELANQLEGMNARRRLESSLVEESALSLLERDPSLLEYAVIVLAHPEWSGGVVGIVANRLAERYNKPVALLCDRDGTAFGSARSAPGCNITDALRACREKLLKFGGHAMAAGMALRSEDLFEFRRMLSRTVREMRHGEIAEPLLDIDGELPLGEISMELARDFRRLAPFGNGNPPLTLVSRNLRLVRRKKLGRKGNHLELLVEDEAGARQRVQWWNAGDRELPAGRFDLAWHLRVSRFGDQPPAVVLEPRDLQARESEAIVVDASAPEYEVVDCANEPAPAEALVRLLADDADYIVWREADSAVAGRTRLELAPAGTLIVWTIPPGPEEWRAALDAVKPHRIVLFGQTPPAQTADTFLQRMGGLIKYAINAKGGRVAPAQRAAATAQRVDAVRHALDWYRAAGQLGIDRLPAGQLLLVQTANEPNPAQQDAIHRLLNATLAETAAYRKHWKG
ncbi:MAG: single-stranded-DNA-specific exonuclease RecJ [Blastocatellia bacterium]|nr:single-stranded-DNA-specific exonuclease RecJ [Blastocatellia bacterium]